MAYPTLLDSNLPLQACYLALGSNWQTTHFLDVAEQPWQQLANIIKSTVILSMDQKHQTTYHNQIWYLQFLQPMTYHQLFTFTKRSETLAERQQHPKPMVTLDIDIIAVQSLEKPFGIWMDEKKQPIQLTDDHWLIFARRLPLAVYERQGLMELCHQHTLSVPPKLLNPS